MEDSSEEMTNSCGTTLKEEPEIESPLSMNHAHFLVKEESLDSNESWVSRIKQEPTTPLSANTPKEELDEIVDQDMYVKLSMNQAHFLVKEESADSNESWIDRIKQEPTSPLSMNTPKQETDEIVDQYMDVKEECGTTVKEETDIESPLSMNKAHFLAKEERMDSNESWFNGLKEDPTSPLSTDTPIEEHDEIEDHDMDVKKEKVGKEEEPDSAEEIMMSCSSEREDHEFIKESSLCSHLECSAWNCGSQIASSATQSLSGDMTAMNCQRGLLKSYFPSEDEILVPGSLQSEKPFAVVPCSSNDTMNREEVAEMFFLKGHFPSKSESKSSPNHEETPYQRSALQSGSLTSSTRKRSFKCNHCVKIFKTKKHLIQHMRIHSGDRPFKCSQCGKSFTQSSSLTSHMLRHTGDRPFKCSQCGNSFTQNSHLTRHMLRHTGERPFKCSQCGKSFTESGHLTVHLRIHSGVRPFKCSQCGISFLRRCHLTRHMRIHRDQPSNCS